MTLAIWLLKLCSFSYDSSILSSEAQQILENNIQWMRKNPSTIIEVEGHCDIRGSVEYNLALGERRAQSVRRFLIQSGISPNQIRSHQLRQRKASRHGL